MDYDFEKVCRAAGLKTATRTVMRHTQPAIPGGGQFGISGGENRLGSPVQLVVRRNIPNSAVQTSVVVMIHKSGHQTYRVIQRQRRIDTNTLRHRYFPVKSAFSSEKRIWPSSF